MIEDGKIELHKRLGLSCEDADAIADDVLSVFEKAGSAIDTIEHIRQHYDVNAIIAGITLNIMLDEYLRDGGKHDRG